MNIASSISFSLATLGLIGSVTPGIYNNPPVLNTSMVGPHLANDRSQMNITVYNPSLNAKKYTLLVYATAGNSKNYPIFNSQQLDYKSKETKSFTINEPNGFLLETGLTYNFVLKDFNSYKVIDKKATYYPNIERSAKLNDYSKVYRSKAYGFQIVNNYVRYKKDLFDFSKTDYCFVGNTYYMLPIDQIVFAYEGDRNIKSCRPSLSFLDVDGLFKNCYFYNSRNIVEIPLKITTKGQLYYSFDFDGEFFVNPKNLDMSYKNYQGYVKTKHFYLPINKSRKIESYNFTLRLKDAGYSKSYLTYDMTYLKVKNLVGKCAESDYCIVAGQNDG